MKEGPYGLELYVLVQVGRGSGGPPGPVTPTILSLLLCKGGAGAPTSDADPMSSKVSDDMSVKKTSLY